MNSCLAFSTTAAGSDVRRIAATHEASVAVTAETPDGVAVGWMAMSALPAAKVSRQGRCEQYIGRHRNESTFWTAEAVAEIPDPVRLDSA